MDQRDSFEFTQQHTVHQTLQNLAQYSINMFQVQKRCLATLRCTGIAEVMGSNPVQA